LSRLIAGCKGHFAPLAEPDEFQARWWYDSAMPTSNHQRGLEMVNIPEGMQRMCGIAHGSFCAKHDLQEWALQITQLQPGVFKIVSTAPIGGTVQNITLRPGLNFGDHLVHLLESHYSVFQHYLRNQAS
jgi:hypothetical protein